MKLKFSLILLTSFFIISCSTTKVVTPQKFKEIVTKPVNEWTYEDCDNMILKYTSYNQKGYDEKYINLSYSGTRVFIKAVPLNEIVIQAKIRKEAIIRRYSEEDYKARLKEELELYTNKTLNMDNRKVILKEGMDRFKLESVSFEVVFENTSQPREPIEIEYASDGFFLENADGDFSRVLEMYGYYIEDYFVLIDKLKAVITFSIFDDNGKNIFHGDNMNKGYKLVFNGFQAEPVIVSWGDPITN